LLSISRISHRNISLMSECARETMRCEKR